MRLLPSDPDVETIVGRINSGDIDLQPDFQRGEVWAKVKKQRLIDSILRDWHVPPIHVIENPKTRKQEVLDGQQRLAAIRDFVQGKFSIDGKTEPSDPSIHSLGGMYYSDLPEEWRRRFNQFNIRIFRIVDYQVSEPAELFFRLNQPATLTGAEQRNAFFGPVREQIKELVGSFEKAGLNKHALAFSNLRMSYDDVLSRTALAVERKTLDNKITSSDLEALYRRDSPIGLDSIDSIKSAIRILAQGLGNSSEPIMKFNKATLFSWLIFLVRGHLSGNLPSSGGNLKAFLAYFARMRAISLHDTESARRSLAHLAPAYRLFTTYETRSAARVADISSVILRDAVIWVVFEDFCTSYAPAEFLDRVKLEPLHSAFAKYVPTMEDDYLAKRLIERGWGRLE